MKILVANRLCPSTDSWTRVTKMNLSTKKCTCTHMCFSIITPQEVALILHSNALRKYEDASPSFCMKINNYKKDSFQQAFYTVVIEKKFKGISIWRS